MYFFTEHMFSYQQAISMCRGTIPTVPILPPTAGAETYINLEKPVLPPDEHEFC